jgi:hypothetical protein
MTSRIGFHRLSRDAGYQPVTYEPSYALPVESITDWSTLPSTDAVRTVG